MDKQSYLDRMTHFDFKTLLPALLQVEDRMSMAHGLESRVPFLDRELVEFAATIPASIKFKNGTMKYILRSAHEPVCAGAGHEPHGQDGLPDALCRMGKGECEISFAIHFLLPRLASESMWIMRKSFPKSTVRVHSLVACGASSAWNCGSKSFMTRPTSIGSD